MPRPNDIDPEALRLLGETDWPWSDHHRGFVEARDPQRETSEEYRTRQATQIGHAELRDHGLAGPAPAVRRETGIRWLRGKLSAAR